MSKDLTKLFLDGTRHFNKKIKIVCRENAMLKVQGKAKEDDTVKKFH
jgi:hypothetical protein